MMVNWRSEMAFKREEELSADALQKHLIAFGYATAASWKPGPDPPDLSFTVLRPNGVMESWGVEVTALTQYVEQSLRKGTKTFIKAVERRVFEPAVHDICERINKNFGSQLSMGYALFVSGPLDPKVFRELEQRILNYIQSGNTEETALDHGEAVALVLKSVGGDPSDPMVQWAVQSVAPQYERVYIKGDAKAKGVWVMSGVSGIDKLPNDGGFVADVTATIEYSIQRILNEKLPIMTDRVHGFDRKLLLIWNDLPLAKSIDVVAALKARKTNGKHLDGIFFIEFGWKTVSLVLDPAGLIGILAPKPVSEGDIAVCAYYSWERRGRPLWSPEVDWFEAERQLKHRTF
jgi:hypothetical protein